MWRERDISGGFPDICAHHGARKQHCCAWAPDDYENKSECGLNIEGSAVFVLYFDGGVNSAGLVCAMGRALFNKYRGRVVLLYK